MIIPSGIVNIDTDIFVADDTGLPVTGLVAATLPPIYVGLDTNVAHGTLVLSDLAAITTAFSAGGVKERMVGRYRLCCTIGTTTGSYIIYGEATGKRVLQLTTLQVVDTTSTWIGVQAIAGNITQIGGVNCSAPSNLGSLVISTNGLVNVGINGTSGSTTASNFALSGTITPGIGGGGTISMPGGTIIVPPNNGLLSIGTNGALTGVTTLLTRIAQPFTYDLDGLPLVDVNEVNGSVLAASGLSTLGVERNNSSTGFLNVNVRMWNGTVTTGMPMPTFTLPAGFTTTTFAATVGTSTYSGGLADTNAAAIKLVTDKLATTLQASGTNWQFTTDALIHGPVGSGLNAQQTRDALDLTATLGGASIDAQLATVLLNAQSANTFANTAAGSGSAANTSATQAYNAAQAARLTTDKLLTTIQASGTNWQFTAGALINAPSTTINAQDIANALKLAPAAGTPAAGSVYDGLSTILTEISALANIGGTGAYTVVIPFVDANAAPLQGVLSTMTKNNIPTIGAPSNTLGLTTYHLNAGTYSLADYLSGYSSTPNAVISVSGSGTTAPQVLTLEVAPSPTNPDDCRLWFYTVDQAGVVVPAARVEWVLTTPATNVVIKRGAADSNSAGYWYLDVTKGSGPYIMTTSTGKITVTAVQTTGSTLQIA
jgi:hypothetical protein